jgi:hypothetical protein
LSNQYTNRLEIVKEALRHTELKLQSSVENATVSDNRFFQFSAAMLVIGTGFLTSENFVPYPDLRVIYSFLFYSLATLAFWIVKPSVFLSLGGSYVDAWKGHLDFHDPSKDDCLIEVLLSQAEENDRRFAENETKLRKKANVFKWLMRIFMFLIISIAYVQFECWQWQCTAK